MTARKRPLPLFAVLTLLLVLIAVIVQVAPLSGGFFAPAKATTGLADTLLDAKCAQLVSELSARQAAVRPAPTEQFSPPWNEVERDLLGLCRAQSFEVAVYVKDLRNGRVISYRPDAPQPSASLVKLPVMIATYRLIAAGKLGYASRLTMRDDLKSDGCGDLKDRPAGSTVSVGELLTKMIGVSDNTACNVLVDYLGMDAVNAVCREYGLTRTDMVRGVMDLQARDAGVENMTTARDMGLALEKLQNEEIWGKDYCREMLGLLLDCHIRDRIPRFLPAGFPVAHKTGLLRDVVHDVGLMYFNDRPVVIAVLTRDMPSYWAGKEFIARAALMVYRGMQEYEAQYRLKFSAAEEIP